ncbi:methionine gamma-lyase family protein [Stenomitos frigidus]|uniref:methionine gamma-lyase family protein n=1 Tax=Stenomitos frigidus TaxID=1886765 RepID=UPI003D64B45A
MRFHLDPLLSCNIPVTARGYESQLVLAGGTFIDGSTSKFSADVYSKNPTLFFVRVALIGRVERSLSKLQPTRSNLLRECKELGEIDELEALHPVNKSYVKGTIGEIILRSVTLHGISPDNRNPSVLCGKNH